MGSAHGVKNLMEVAEALEEIADLVNAMKGDDGKISLGDAMRPSVWKEAGELTAAAKAAYGDISLLVDEVKDLDQGEASQVLAAYVASGSKLISALSK